MSLYRSAGPSTSLALTGLTEFDILKANHKFLREDGTRDAEQSWEDKLAQKYYSNLYREYAVCDLKHYKSGNFALRWRTEEEVVAGAGESTCGNTRCALHPPCNIDPADPRPPLKTLELPFAYAEGGEAKSALVKVVLCDRCFRKLMWKRNKEKERGARGGGGDGDVRGVEGKSSADSERSRRKRRDSRERRRPDHPRSRSRSPHGEKGAERRRRSP